MKKIAILFLLLLTVACNANSKYVVQKFPEDQDLERKQRAGNLFKDKNGIVIFDANSVEKKSSSTEKSYKNENNDLWQKAVDVVSDILPISIIDENLGLITTDWGNIEFISNNNNLYKINLIVKNDINISVFEKTKNGESKKSPEMEEKIKQLIMK